MCIHDFTIEELEDMVFHISKCYEDSESYQLSLAYIKKCNVPLYKNLLFMEAVACGAI